jgi:AcrR family transcriptional regulator
MPTTPKRRLTAEERRTGILDAALAVFSERGYHDSSIDEIAGEAGVSKALIYEHFASKRDLHASLLEAHVEELFRRLQAGAAPGQPGEERLRRGIDAFLSFVEEHREAWRALFRDAADPDVGAFVVRVQAQATAVIAALIAADPEAPEGGDRAIEMHAAMLSGALQSLANWWHDHQEVPRTVLVDRAMDFCWVGLRAHTGA